MKKIIIAFFLITVLCTAQAQPSFADLLTKSNTKTNLELTETVEAQEAKIESLRTLLLKADGKIETTKSNYIAAINAANKIENSLRFLYWLIGICVTIFVSAAGYFIYKDFRIRKMDKQADEAFSRVCKAEEDLQEKIQTAGDLTQKVETDIAEIIGRIQALETRCEELSKKSGETLVVKEIDADTRNKVKQLEDSKKETEKHITELSEMLTNEIKAKKSIGIRPNPTLYFRRGMNASNKGDFEEAIANFNKAIELKPDYADAYLFSGNAKCELKRYISAINNFDKALELRPDNALAYFNRAVAKGKLQDYEGEIDDYSKAISLYGKNSYEAGQCYYNRSAAFISLANSKGLKPGPNNYFYSSKADALAAMKFYEPKAMYNLACAEAMLLEKKNAFVHLEEAISRNLISLKHVEEDEDWEHLRYEPEYKRIIEEFENKSEEE